MITTTQRHAPPTQSRLTVRQNPGRTIEQVPWWIHGLPVLRFRWAMAKKRGITRAIIPRRYSDARHRAFAGTRDQLQHVRCRPQRRIAGRHAERQRFASQDA